MAKRVHHYSVTVEWTGNRGLGTPDYAGYGREHLIHAAGKAPIAGSSDPEFRGDAARWNPEELLVGSLSACHKLWYLHLCSAAGISVVAYRDEAVGTMTEDADGSGRFASVVLRPVVRIRTGDDTSMAEQLHAAAHRYCFIANSVAFPVTCEPRVEVATSAADAAANGS